MVVRATPRRPPHRRPRPVRPPPGPPPRAGAARRPSARRARTAPRAAAPRTPRGRHRTPSRRRRRRAACAGAGRRGRRVGRRRLRRRWLLLLLLVVLWLQVHRRYRLLLHARRARARPGAAARCCCCCCHRRPPRRCRRQRPPPPPPLRPRRGRRARAAAPRACARPGRRPPRRSGRWTRAAGPRAPTGRRGRPLLCFCSVAGGVWQRRQRAGEGARKSRRRRAPIAGARRGRVFFSAKSVCCVGQGTRMRITGVCACALVGASFIGWLRRTGFGFEVSLVMCREGAEERSELWGKRGSGGGGEGLFLSSSPLAPSRARHIPSTFRIQLAHAQSRNMRID